MVALRMLLVLFLLGPVVQRGWAAITAPTPGINFNPPSNALSPAIPLPITITNYYSGTLSGCSLNNDSQYFTKTGDCSTLHGGDSCIVNLVANPPGAGTFPDTLSLACTSYTKAPTPSPTPACDPLVPHPEDPYKCGATALVGCIASIDYCNCCCDTATIKHQCN